MGSFEMFCGDESYIFDFLTKNQPGPVRRL
jgi:hypothetical protein